jgi:metal-sulfur cluster biosynthetic enzyme
MKKKLQGGVKFMEIQFNLTPPWKNEKIKEKNTKNN